MPGRIIGTRLPCNPGRDSRYTLRRHLGRWWVHYEPPGGDPIPADDAHEELVALINALKGEMVQGEGGPFSINEHGQVIARMKAPPGQGNTMHVINVSRGSVSTYTVPLIFQQGPLSPTAVPQEGEIWPGPMCGMTYTFTAPGNCQAPSRNLDEVFVKEEGQILQLSTHAGIRPYPPRRGPLAAFLLSLRRRLPPGGRFRVNEHGRAFTSNGSIFIGTIPRAEWFRPLTPRS